MIVGGLLLAAGSAARFGQQKQFLELAPGVRLVDAALANLQAVVDHTVLVLPDGIAWSGAEVDAVTVGGATRLESVRAGLEMLAPCDIVVVHDAGHPLASVAAAHAVVDAVKQGADAAVPWLPVVDVLKRVREDGSLETAGRDGLGQAQTPHAFRAHELHALHRVPTSAAWEDTQLIEERGGRVVGVAGDAGNIHVVTPDDLEVARRLYSTISR